MKRGTSFVLPVTFQTNLDDVETIEFYFKQGGIVEEFLYPSERAIRAAGTNTVNLIWDRDLTYTYKADKQIEMDTRITLKNISTNPETEIQSFTLSRTLFPAEE